MNANTSKPLNGLIVVELGTSVAAPFAGLILADLGARVVKVENPNGGDHARSWGPPFWGDTSSSFFALNRGKSGITIDFTNEGQVADLRKFIVSEADAVIQNLRPGLLDKFGLSSKNLCRDNPSLIWCDIGAFGAEGPLATKPGYDPLVQAATGIMSVTGEIDRPPVRAGVSLVDMGSGMWAVIGLMAALIERSRSGVGSEIKTSLFETGLAWMTIPLSGYEASGVVRRPYGSGMAEIVPYQAFKTSDSWLMIAAGNDGLFRKLCKALGLEELADNADYATNPRRVANRKQLIETLSNKMACFTTDGLSARLDQAGVPNAPLLTVDQVAAHPQTQALNMTVQCEGDSLPVMGVPLSFDGKRPRATSQAPKLGEHNGNLNIKKVDG